MFKKIWHPDMVIQHILSRMDAAVGDSGNPDGPRARCADQLKGGARWQQAALYGGHNTLSQLGQVRKKTKFVSGWTNVKPGKELRTYD